MSDEQGSDEAATTTLDRLMAAQEPPRRSSRARVGIRAANSAARRHLVVLDDDPTGSQVVHDVPVLTSWDDEDLLWAFGQSSNTFFILTNTRSMGSAATRDLLVDLARRIDRVAVQVGTQPVLLSRSDSTLRGHFPLETDVLAQVASEQGHGYDAVLLVPAYLDAGRVTVDDVHYARVGEDYVPVGQTQYATDDAFGYRSSDLREWVREKVGDPDFPVMSLSLTDIRKGGVDVVTGKLLEAREGTVVVVNALEDSDLETVVLGLAAAEATGWRTVCRVGPSFVPVRAGLERRPPLTAEDIFVGGGAPAGSGLVVVGSHVDLTTRQVDRLLELDGVEKVELDVRLLQSDEDASAELDRCTAAVAAAAGLGDVLLLTSRVRMILESGEASLDFARRVSAALVEITRRTVDSVDLGWVLAKGGITSHDIATDGLRMRRAMVLGQLFDGIVSVWRNDSADDLRLTGLPYVVFAGNVGDESTLRDAVGILRGGPGA